MSPPLPLIALSDTNLTININTQSHVSTWHPHQTSDRHFLLSTIPQMNICISSIHAGLLRKNIFWMQYFRKQNKSDLCRISWYPLCIGIEIDNFCQIHIATWYLCTLWCACSKLKVSYIMGYNPTDRTEKLIHNLGLQWQSWTNWSIAKWRHQTVLTVSIFYCEAQARVRQG